MFSMKVDPQCCKVLKLLWENAKVLSKMYLQCHLLEAAYWSQDKEWVECFPKVLYPHSLFLPPLSFSTQPPPAYSHPSTASYSVQQASAVAHAVTASYSPAPVQAARPVVTAPYAAYQSHQAPPDYAYRQPEPPAPLQPTTAPQTYQVYSDTVSLFKLHNDFCCLVCHCMMWTSQCDLYIFISHWIEYSLVNCSRTTTTTGDLL